MIPYNYNLTKAWGYNLVIKLVVILPLTHMFLGYANTKPIEISKIGGYIR